MAERGFTSATPTVICWKWSHRVYGASFGALPRITGETSPVYQWRRCQALSRTLQQALGEERHFAVVEPVPFQPRLARNQFHGTQYDPCISSVHNLDHDSYFELLSH